MCEEQGEEM